MKILVYGYGNPGRQDDGLGIRFAEQIELWSQEKKINCISVEQNYQLNIEDSDTIAMYDYVFFADATIENWVENMDFTEVNPSDSSIEFTMHAVSPSFILDLCNKLYKKSPKTYLLHLKGYEYELAEGLTPKAEENLQLALEFMKTEILRLISWNKINYF